MSREDKLKHFNPSENIDRKNNIFGLPFNANESKLVLLPVPWDVTTSGKDGAANGPDAIFEASFRIDLYDEFYPEGWKEGISMDITNQYWLTTNQKLREKVKDYLAYLENPTENRTLKRIRQLRKTVNEINAASVELNAWVRQESLSLLKSNKIVGLVGGDHSSPVGLLLALSEVYDSFAVLHIDAHADLRKAYERFQFSHASIMYHATHLPHISKLVQIGIRDYCQEEQERIERSHGRMVPFTDRQLKQAAFKGVSWHEQVQQIIKELPELVYISFDIDGLSPDHCPNTGTPVPGGLQFEEAAYLLEQLTVHNKKIIGFDLCEVAPGPQQWDEFVGAKMLYKLALATLKSQK